MSVARKFTQRQLLRREDILSAAREMIAERGYDGVNMRDLAIASGVTPKTLYHQFENKEGLLRIAVEEKFREVYQSINDKKIGRGLDRLFFVIEAIAKSIRDNEAYATALAPFLSRQSKDSSFTLIRINTYQRVLEQIASEGELEPSAEVELLAGIIQRQIGSVFQSWRHDEIPLSLWSDMAKLDVCLMLASVTTGQTHERIIAVTRELQVKLVKFF